MSCVGQMQKEQGTYHTTHEKCLLQASLRPSRPRSVWRSHEERFPFRLGGRDSASESETGREKHVPAVLLSSVLYIRSLSTLVDPPIMIIPSLGLMNDVI